ncbi:hypothetical protein MIZ01_1589 [Sideroxyarcus emersonii]|uniref:Uncharacterized protein n=1 Tax=Sideroxyarcus emersonii TaxID=2764705 RepID=A0AAN1XAI4_9PROT|nr:hypothetical protein [Sideroxyarcus emersonii]BCK87793.1 hypothetical protein MIZ01_1589 [Sideroxyarcus emersonii]
MSLKFLVGALAFLLAACSNPVTNSAGSDQSSASGFEYMISWTKKLVRSWSAKASLQVPAEGIIADALIDPKFAGGRIDGAEVRELVFKKAQNNDFQKYMKEGVGPGYVATNRKDLKQIFEPGTYLLPVSAIVSSYRGWPVGMMDMNEFGERGASENEKLFYLGFQEAAVEYTNSLFTKIAMELNNDVGVLEDPQSAKQAIQQIYKSIPKTTLDKLWVDAVDHAAGRGSRTVDLNGNKGVDWIAGGSSYSGGPDGLTWAKNGVAWFGKGALSGKQWTIGLESSISKSTDKSSSDSENVGGQTGEKSSAGAQPK